MNRLKKSILSLGLALSCGGAFAQGAPTKTLISETTFDNGATSPWTFGYYYPDSAVALGTFSVDKGYYFPEDVDLTDAVYRYSFDLTALDGMVGFGTGTGAPLFRADTDPALFKSGDRNDYAFTFDAKAEGLLAGQTASAEFQVQLYHKNDAGQDMLTVQVNLPFQATADWQTFSFNLGDGALGANTLDADLAQFHDTTTDLRFAVNLHEPFRGYGYDADNALDLNNVKLEVIDRAATVVLPTYAAPIVDWNMDDKPVWYSYSYGYASNNNNPLATTGNNANNVAPNTFGKDGTSAWYLTMDNSNIPSAMPDWAGVGSGGEGPVDITKIDSANLADYRVTFDARVEGLAEGRTESAAALQFFPEVADGPDDGTDPDTLGRFDFAIARVSADWQTYTFQLSKASTDAATKAAFANLYQTITGFKLQWQIDNAHSEADWGFDADNALYIDNIKVERIYEGLAPLNFAQQGDQLVLTWTDAATGTTTLQAADLVDGPYTNVSTTGSTFSAPTNGTQKYFRLAWTAPEVP